jgi:hypothetical protein
MEVVALQEIKATEEVICAQVTRAPKINNMFIFQICIPYVDPALIDSRQQITKLTYGFSCICPSCISINAIGAIPPLPVSEAALADLDNALQRFCIPSGDIDEKTLLAGSALQELPENLYCVLHEGYLSRLTDIFSRSSHEGSYRVALHVGLSVFAVYLLIYPANYPQIGRKLFVMQNLTLDWHYKGMHLLEMAKTAWNAVIDADQDVPAKASLLKRARVYLGIASKVIKLFGPEGDPGGPLEELAFLEDLLEDDEQWVVQPQVGSLKFTDGTSKITTISGITRSVIRPEMTASKALRSRMIRGRVVAISGSEDKSLWQEIIAALRATVTKQIYSF